MHESDTQAAAACYLHSMWSFPIPRRLAASWLLRLGTLTALSPLTSAAAADLTLVRRGMPRSAVVLPAEPSPLESYAARELVEHITRISGSVLPVVREGSSAHAAVPKSHTTIWLGATTRATDVEIPPLGFAIHAGKRSLVIVGHDDPGRDDTVRHTDPYDQVGTLNGVYDLLQDQLGVRWVWSGESGIVTPQTDTIRIPRSLSVSESPQLKTRLVELLMTRRKQAAYQANLPWLPDDTLQEIGSEEIIYLRRLRFGGYQPWRAGGHAYSRWFLKHREHNLEFFALQPDGTRGPVTGPSYVKMCVSEPGLWDAIIDEWAARKKYSKTVTIAENDGNTGYCTCERCRAWDVEGATWIGPRGKPLPKYTDRYITFANIIAERIETLDPEHFVRVYGYNAMQDPPERETLRHNIAVETVEGIYPRTPEEDARFRDHWKRWRAAGGGRYGWRPNIFYLGYSMPFVYADHAGRDMRFLIDNGLDYVYIDGMTGYWSEVGPSYYVPLRMLWDTELDPEEALDEYYSAFGSAGDAVRAYYDFWEAASQRWGTPEGMKTRLSHGGGYRRNFRLATLDIYPDEDWDHARGLLAEARRAAGGDSTVLARVSRIERILEHSRQTAEVVRLYEKPWGKTWLMAADHLPHSQALKDRRLELLPENATNIALLSHDEVISGDLAGLAALRDTEGTNPIARLPLNWSIRLDPDSQGLEEAWQDTSDGDPAWTLYRSNGNVARSVPARKWEKANDWEPYTAPAWMRTTVSIPEEAREASRALFFPKLEGKARIWLDGELVLERDRASGSVMLPLPDGRPTFVVTVYVESYGRTRGGIQRPPWLIGEASNAP